MFFSFRFHRLGRYIALDTALLLATLCLLHFGKDVFSTAADPPEGVFLPVLMYHSVTNLPETSFCVTPDTLQQDLQYLQENGYETVSAEMLVKYTQGEDTLPEKPILLTFDDGLYNNLSLVLPLLESFQMCAIVSLVGAFTDVYAPDAPHNDNYSYLTWTDAAICLESDRIEFGSHTYDLHSDQSGERQGCSIRSGESEEDYHNMLYSDLSLLQNRFQEQLQMTPIVFAYPYGFVSPESVPVLRELGFQMTLTCLEQPNYITQDPACLYGIGRYNRYGNCDTETFMTQILSES